MATPIVLSNLGGRAEHGSISQEAARNSNHILHIAKIFRLSLKCRGYAH